MNNDDYEGDGDEWRIINVWDILKNMHLYTNSKIN